MQWWLERWSYEQHSGWIKTTTDFELDTTDGVKILKEDGWVIIRPSGTEPIFRCFAESDSQKKADAMTEWGLSLIKKYKH